MATLEKTLITVEATIHAPVEKVWQLWTDPKHIIHWNNASDDWFTPSAESDLRAGGKFVSRMEAKDGSQGFDFSGEYLTVKEHKQIEYRMADDREARISFVSKGEETKVTETFEAEHTNTIELQRSGWQSILNNFKKYVETMKDMNPMHFEISINANAEKVYKTLLGEKTYMEWTSVFNATSHYEGSWEKGSKILFLGIDHNGNMGGMVSRIKENIPHKFVSIEHLGEFKDGKEITSGPEVSDWAGALENYTFKEERGKTLFSVDIDFNEQYKSYFETMWPKALNKLKEICER